MTTRRRFLCICQGGMVRSAALAWQLKIRGQDVICASAQLNSPTTLKMLWDWADFVVAMCPEILDELPDTVKGRALWMVNVGEDRYGSPFHYLLQGKVIPIVNEWAAADFDLTKTSRGVKPEAVSA